MNRKKIIYLLSFSIIIGFIFSSFASSSPDGLEKVAESQGFIGAAINHWDGIMPDYEIAGFGNSFLSVGLAGLTGTFITFLILLGFTSALAKAKIKK
jgi:hypothetical protein